MIEAFYITSVTGVALLSWPLETMQSSSDQLFAGLIAALENLSVTITGSSIETFKSKEMLFSIKQFNKNFNFVLVTKLGVQSRFISDAIEQIQAILDTTDFLDTAKDANIFFDTDSDLYKKIDIFLKDANKKYSQKAQQRDYIEREGTIKQVLKTFKESSIYLWRSILLGKKFIVTSAYEQTIHRFVNSLLLFYPDDSQYYIFPNFNIQDVERLKGKSTYILGSTSSFILMMRKDLWDIHIDLDKSEIKTNNENLQIEQTERELFNEILSMIEVGDPSEEIIREEIQNINSKLATVLKLLKEDQSNLNNILKRFNISKNYYANFISKLDFN
jgi:hypothetical protein